MCFVLVGRECKEHKKTGNYNKCVVHVDSVGWYQTECVRDLLSDTYADVWFCLKADRKSEGVFGGKVSDGRSCAACIKVLAAVINNSWSLARWQVGDVNRERNRIAYSCTCVCVRLCAASPVEVDAFLCDLSGSVFGVCAGFITDDLHPFASSALLTAVLADHV